MFLLVYWREIGYQTLFLLNESSQVKNKHLIYRIFLLFVRRENSVADNKTNDCIPIK